MLTYMLVGLIWGQNPVFAIIFGALIYRDANKLHSKGVRVSPGIITGVFLLFAIILSSLSFSLMRLDWIDDGLSFVLSLFAYLIPLGIYLIVRHKRVQEMTQKSQGVVGNIKKQSPPKKHTWLTVVVILIPIIATIMAFCGLAAAGTSPPLLCKPLYALEDFLGF